MDQLNLSITGFVHSEDFADHNYSLKHAEIPGRTQSIDKVILEFNHPNMEETSHFGECSKDNILLVHKEEYFNFIENQFKDKDESIKEQFFYGDTYTNRNTANVARKFVQGVLLAVDKVMSGQWNNAFCSVRPPGHHSGHKENPNGFCIYNNVAIAAQYARQKYQLTKILILDWDVHHCDGTESIFYNDPNTLVISIHRYDDAKFYPNSGHPESIGNLQGKYFNINVGWNVKDPIIPGYDDYVYAYDRLLAPIITQFNPQLIIISAGYDSAKGDPLGQINNTPEGYQYITSKLIKICPKLIAVLEGGYNLEVTAQCALATFKTLLGEEQEFSIGKPNKVGLQAVTKTTLLHQEFWQCLLQKDLVMKQEQLLGLSREFIAGGHQHAFQIQGDKLIKKTKESELLFYKEVITGTGKYVEENKAIRNLIPQVFNVNMKHQCLIMENLTYQLEKASIIDLKIGFKTYDPNGSKAKRIKEIGKCLRSGQNILGFRVAGVKLRDKQGNIVLDKFGSQARLEYNTKEKVTELISSVLKSNESEINQDALKQLMFLLNNIAKFIDHSKRFFRSSSILLIVDNISKKCNTRWIDFSYVQPLKDDTDDPNSEIDKSLLNGLISLLEILMSLQN